MKQTLLFSTFLISSFSFAQNYAVDQIPADLIKDAYAVVRKNEEKIELLKVDELKCNYSPENERCQNCIKLKKKK